MKAPSPENVAGECQTMDCPEPEAYIVEFKFSHSDETKRRFTYCQRHADIVTGCFCTHGCEDKEPLK